MPEAARILDQVQHTPALAALIVGAVAGAAIGAAVVLTGGAAAVAISAVAVSACTGASIGGGLAEFIGSLISIKTGPITGPCAIKVFLNGRKAARSVIDLVDCSGILPGPPHPKRNIAEGSTNVFIEGLPAARKTDQVTCGSQIGEGSPNIFIGGGRNSYIEVSNEVPLWLELGLFALGLVGGVGWALKGATKALKAVRFARLAAGIVGGIGGGIGGHWLGGKFFGERSRGQKIAGFLGAVIGAGFAEKLVTRLSVKVGTGVPRVQDIASVDQRKFSEYIFREGAEHGKDTVFRGLGYNREDSAALADLYQQQGAEKFLAHDYTLGKADEFGQRINIEIELPGKGSATGEVSHINSGWMLKPDGSISLNTPFSGFTR